MAIYRNIQTSFWTDSKVTDDFTMQEKYLFLYLLTNPHTNLCGCYEISKKQIAFDTDMPKEAIEESLKRLAEYEVAFYSDSTKEVLIVNWSRHNWSQSKGDKMRVPLEKEIKNIKDAAFRDYLLEVFNGDEPSKGDLQKKEKRNQEDMEDISLIDGGCDLPITISITNTNSITDTSTSDKEDGGCKRKAKLVEDSKAVIRHLNNVTGKRYRENDRNVAFVTARLNEHFTVEECMAVIDKKAAKWMHDPKMRDYLRPQTLFGTKFESYLNEPDADARSGTTGGRNAAFEQLMAEIAEEEADDKDRVQEDYSGDDADLDILSTG